MELTPFLVLSSCDPSGFFKLGREIAWLRWRDGGDPPWFEDRNRVPGTRPHATPSETVAAVVALRTLFPRFWPKKIKARIAMDRPDMAWPAAATIGGILNC